jgi:hypothetical protein
MAEKDGALKPAAEEALAVAPETGTTVQPTWAKEQWDIIKSKARDAREYVVTKTRQPGILHLRRDQGRVRRHGRRSFQG